MANQPSPSLDAFLALVAERDADAAEALSDGRRMRTERGRAAVVEALLELVNEGTHPTVAQIAERAGVSERTVFRYFPDREAMYTAAAVEIFPKVSHCLSIFPPDGPFEVRLRRLLEFRVELTQIGANLSQWVESDDKPSQLQLTVSALRQEQLRNQIASWFGPELVGANERLVPVVNAMTSLRSVGMLLEEFSPDECIDVLQQAITQMLRP
jgi:AcrR family transcriptional regulator